MTASPQKHRPLITRTKTAYQRLWVAASTRELGGTGLATWSSPAGGYFVSLDVPAGCAREVVSKAAAAGIALTPAGSTHPYRHDPQDSTIRIAPSFPYLAELETAIMGLTVCVRLVGAERLLTPG